MSHLNALELRLSNERNYFAMAKTDGERELRRVWVRQIEDEIAAEIAFLGKMYEPTIEMSDDELLAELFA